MISWTSRVAAVMAAFILLLAGVASPCFGRAQEAGAAKRPMTFADLMAMKRVSDPQISSSGRWVMFSVTDVSLEKNTKTNHLWVVPIDGSRPEAQLTFSDAGVSQSNGRFSPDGKWVMYTAPDAKGRSEILVAPWDETRGAWDMRGGRFKATPVTDLETEADGAIWAPDSRHFVFVSRVYPECESKAPMGPERDAQEASCNVQKDAEAEKNPVKGEIFTHLLYRHWNAFVGPKRSHVFYGALPAEGAMAVPPTDLTPASVIGDHEAPTFSLGGPLGYAISPDGKEVAYVTNLDKVPAESTNNDVFTLRVGAEPSTAKRVSTSPGSDDGPQYSPDGRWLAWRSQARGGFESDKFGLTLYDRAAGKVKTIRLEMKDYSSPGRPVTSDLDRWVDEFTWVDDSKHILFVAGDRGEAPIYETNITGDDLHRFGKARGEWSDVQTALLKGRPAIVGSLMRVDSPAKIVLADPLKLDDSAREFAVALDNSAPVRETTQRTYEPVALEHLNDTRISAVDMAAMESFWFAGAGGTKVQGFVIRPPSFDASRKYPLKFLIHGGPQGAWGDAWSYRWNPELLAANGYVVVMVNPRGSTGYGQQFVDEVSGDWGGRAYQDLMRGLDYAEVHYPFIDKNRECALGASYGGFMANWVLTHTHRFKCIVTHDGMYNPQSAFGDTEELWFNEWEFRPLAGTGPHVTVEQSKPAHPWDFYDKPASEDPFRKWSPMLAIKNARTPTLVVHSQRDYRLDVSEGMQLFTALQLLGVPSEMLYFPDEGHWVLKPRNSELWHKTVNDWIDRWTGTNAYAGVGPEKNPMAEGAGPMRPGTRTGVNAARRSTEAPKAQTKDKSDR